MAEIRNVDGVLTLVRYETVRVRNGDWYKDERKEVVYNLKGYNWGCFTSQANKRISILAQQLLNKCFKNPARVVEYLYEFHYKWDKMYQVKSYRESGCNDTDVREVVGDFHDKVADAFGLNGYEIWESMWSNYRRDRA